jgi:hypothetical protein
MFEALLKCIDLLTGALRFSRESRRAFFEKILEPLFQAMEAVHGDYAASWAKISETLAPEWQRGTSDFDQSIQNASIQLVQFRATLKAPRDKLLGVLSGYEGSRLSQHERDFVEALIAYFPRGEVHPSDLVDSARMPEGTPGTDYSLVAQQFYKYLEEGKPVDLHRIISRTMERESHAWKAVCKAFAALQVHVYRGV